MMHSQAQHTAHDLCAVGPSSCRGDKRGDATRSGTGTMSTSMPSKSSTAEERGKSESLKPFSKNTRALWRRRGKPSLMNLTLPVPRRMKLVAASHVLFVPQKNSASAQDSLDPAPFAPQLSASAKSASLTRSGPTGTRCSTRRMGLSGPWLTATNFCAHGRISADFTFLFFFKFFTLFDQ